MAKKRKQKTKTDAAGYVEKLSSQVFDRIKKELEKSFRVMPSDKMKKIKKMLPGLKKQVQKRIKEELAKSFRMTPASKVKSRKKTKKAKRK